MPLGILDIIILTAAFGSAIVIGLRAHKSHASLDAYLLGDRNLPWWAILGSIVATETSTATVLSIPGYGYSETGWRFLQLAAGYVLGRILVVLFLLPAYFDGRLLSAYEVLGTRFGPKTKQAAALLFLVARNLGDGLRLFLAAMVLQKLAGWPLAGSAFVVGGVTIFYTFFGGMRSVVWNDCVQFVIYIVGSLTAMLYIVSQLPEGWHSLSSHLAFTQRWTFVDTSMSQSEPFNIWAGIIGGAFLSLGSHGTDQMMVQRYLSARSERDAGRAILLSGIVVFLQFTLFLLIGMLISCFYVHHGGAPAIKNDEVFAHFMIHNFPKNTGLIGLMLAAILAAAMSTLSSSLSASASAVVSEWGWARNPSIASSDRQVTTTRWLTVFFGLVQIIIGIYAGSFEKSVVDNALTIAGFASGILLGWFALGICVKGLSDGNAIVSGLCGLATLLAIQFILPHWGWKVAYPWLAVIGTLTTFAPGWILATLRPQLPGEKLL